jgi:hypothetical protein
MTSMTTTTADVTGGVDTHGNTHHAAALDPVGRQLGDREFPATPAGYRALVNWLQTYGHLERVGVEGTGTYGAGLTRQLRARSPPPPVVPQPDRPRDPHDGAHAGAPLRPRRTGNLPTQLATMLRDRGRCIVHLSADHNHHGRNSVPCQRGYEHRAISTVLAISTELCTRTPAR